MAKQLDKVIVLDVESTCWDGLRAPPGEVSEIIEIGLCLVDTVSLIREQKRSILVCPQRSTVGPFCTELTSIKPEMLNGAPTLGEAIEVLRDQYKSETRVFASWGDYDRNQFHRNCREFALTYPFGPTHLNIKNLFSLAFGLPRELGIDEACQHLGIRMEGTHHRGVDDAWNIANLFCLLLKRMRRGV